MFRWGLFARAFTVTAALAWIVGTAVVASLTSYSPAAHADLGIQSGGIYLTVNRSGDSTGGADTSNIQAALTKAAVPYGSTPPGGPTAGGNVVGLACGVYTINAPLKIGNYTTLDARCAVINLLSGTNNNMLQNQGATAVLTSTGSIGAAGSTMSFQNGGSDPMYLALAAINPTLNTGISPWGVVLTIPNTYASNGFSNTNALYVANFQHLNSFNQAQLDTNAQSTVSNQTVTLYYRDTNVTVLGGVWNYGTNGSGASHATDHALRFFNCDGLTLSGLTILSSGSNGLYAVSLTNVSTARIERIYFDVNPGDWPWTTNHGPGFARDGIHINGPARDIHIVGLYGSTGDDLLSITSSDWTGIVNNAAGNVTNVTAEKLFAGYIGANVARVNAGPGTTVSQVRIVGATGTANAIAAIGDDHRQVATEGGTIDDLLLADFGVTNTATSGPTIAIAGLGMQRIKFRDMNLTQVASSSFDLIDIGLDGTGTSVTSTIADLTLERINVQALTAGKKAVSIASGSTVSQLRFSDWMSPATYYPLLSNSGTLTTAFSNDKLPIVALTAQTASITATTAYTCGLAGKYRFAVNARTTTAGTAGTASASIITNNGSAALTQTTSSTIALATLGSEIDQTFTAYCGAGQNIQYSTTVSGATGSPQYALGVTMEYIGKLVTVSPSIDAWAANDADLRQAA